jgi:hypothetical protein
MPARVVFFLRQTGWAGQSAEASLDERDSCEKLILKWLWFLPDMERKLSYQ